MPKSSTLEAAKSKAGRLVHVEWEDSSQPIARWQWIDEYEIPEVVNCLSVGFLIAETPEAIALAPNLGDLTKERCQASGIIRIPKPAIRRIVGI